MPLFTPGSRGHMMHNSRTGGQFVNINTNPTMRWNCVKAHAPQRDTRWEG